MLALVLYFRLPHIDDVKHSLLTCQDADPVSPLRSVVSSKRLGGSGTGGSSNNSVSEAEQVPARWW